MEDGPYRASPVTYLRPYETCQRAFCQRSALDCTYRSLKENPRSKYRMACAMHTCYVE